MHSSPQLDFNYVYENQKELNAVTGASESNYSKTVHIPR